MRTNIRRPLFDGMREVHAIWFDIALLGEAQARRRVLAHWQSGARLHLAAGGYLLSLARPVLADCRALDGLAMCKIDGILSSAPLAADERRAAAAGACWLVRGAQAHALALPDADQVDPAGWLDLAAIVVCTPLAPPTGKAFAALAAPEENRSLREILDNVVPLPSARRDAFLSAAKAAANRKTWPGVKGGAPAKGIAGAGMAAAGMAIVAAALTAAVGVGMQPILLGRLFGIGFGGGSGGRGTGAGGSGANKEAAQRNGPQPAWMQRLNAALARIAVLTKISKVIGWRQAAYLRKMLAMLEQGDVAEALRHAIPLDGNADSMNQALGALKARSSLDITAPGGTVSAIYLDGSVQQYLRDHYRKLFLRLEREGRIDEATFVLAELLKSGVEAVDYLERNGRLRQAAQLAGTLALAPEIAVRLWILAGDATRAVQIARATNAFADAVHLLERKQDAQAGGLRALWAEYLAERGDLIEAVDAIWPLAAYRSVALAWLLQAEQAGRSPSARALVRKLALMPESLADSVIAIDAMLGQPGEDGAALRAALAEELLNLGEHSHATRRLAQEVLRHVLAERSAGLNDLSNERLDKLIKAAGAGMLKSDLPTLRFSTKTARLLGSAAEPLLVRGGERGLLQIHDARRLPDGHYLLALGERGVIRVNASGKQLVHFPLPAYQLVLAANGERALALARRGDVVRVSRIDLLSCKASDWLSHPFDFWAPQYDGLVWNAVIDNRVVAIDTSKDQLAIVWQVADLPGRVFDFLDDGKEQVVLIGGQVEVELWRYALPSRRLTQRDAYPLPGENVTQLMGVANNPAPAEVLMAANGGEHSVQVELGRGAVLKFVLGEIAGRPDVATQDGWVMVQTRSVDGAFRCQVADKRMQKIVADLRLNDADEPQVRAHDRHILMFDRRGRLVDVDCMTGVVRTLSLS